MSDNNADEPAGILGIFRWPVLILAVVLSGPSFWRAFAADSMEPTTALLRFLIAIPIAAGMLLVVRLVASSYKPPAPAQTRITPPSGTYSAASGSSNQTPPDPR
jgi:cytochrome b561